ncbi:MAG: HepT-like ribonuclease domain-containing protein [Candidatus Saccharicenans sp.]|uniref:HepT-like ribonuclease domain-containing protein n=1 Tax=Candidatus Saccharicenans sp. TaxID=2819258 RepID=UPI00404B9E0C
MLVNQLAKEEIINKRLCPQPVKIVGLRNIIAHDFREIDYHIVYDSLPHRLEDMREFIETTDRKIPRKHQD